MSCWYHSGGGDFMKQKHWYHYLWIWSILYFSLGFVNILFAWLGLISFCLPLLFAIIGGNKLFCNRYCDRGQLLRFLGSQLVFSKRHDMPEWMYGKAFRYGFMVFFLPCLAILSILHGWYPAGQPLCRNLLPCSGLFNCLGTGLIVAM